MIVTNRITQNMSFLKIKKTEPSPLNEGNLYYMLTISKGIFMYIYLVNTEVPPYVLLQMQVNINANNIQSQKCLLSSIII